MPIVFEEVTGEIASEREAPQGEAPEQPSSGGEDVAEALRRQVHLMRERERRVRAD